jgi:hypothetical protein
MIVRNLMIDGNIAMKDTTLQNPTGIDSLGAWLNIYIAAFGTIRAAQGALAIGNFNYTTSLIADAANRNIFAIQSALRRLRSFSVPPMLIEFLDRLCGPKIGSEDDPVVFPIILNAMPTSTVLGDLTNANFWTTQLALAETNLSSLNNNTVTPALIPDFQAIGNTFAMAYGTPDIPLDKDPEQDPCVYLMWRSQNASWVDTTGAKTYTWPTVNPATGFAGIFPLLIPRDYKGPALRQAMSHFKGGLFSADSSAGVADTALGNQVGLLNNQGALTQGTLIMNYKQDGVAILGTATSAGVQVLSYVSPYLEMVNWSSEAGGQATDYGADARALQGIDRVYVTPLEMVSETNYLMESMFLEPVRNKGRSTYR